MKILITGGTGSIGCHVVEHILKNTDWDIIVLDCISYAGNILRLNEVCESGDLEKRVDIVPHNIRLPLDIVHNKIGLVDYVVHLAAETHVERSLAEPMDFVLTNVVGTANMLEYVRKFQPQIKKYIQISTDEVFGAAPEGVNYKEWDRHKPSNPYSATKAGADDLAWSYYNSFKLPIIITQTMNNFGEMQGSEKFIPKTIKTIMAGEPVIIHGKKGNASRRKWLHSRNHADALLFLLENGVSGDKYNVVGNVEMDVETLAIKIAKLLEKDIRMEYVDYHSVRPGHDFRYSLDGSKLEKMGWKPKVDFEKSLEKTIKWTKEHPYWLNQK